MIVDDVPLRRFLLYGDESLLQLVADAQLKPYRPRAVSHLLSVAYESCLITDASVPHPPPAVFELLNSPAMLDEFTAIPRAVVYSRRHSAATVSSKFT